MHTLKSTFIAGKDLLTLFWTLWCNCNVLHKPFWNC